MVVQHGCQQVVGSTDGVEIAGKVQVDVLHGHHLGIAAASRTALYAEHGAERGLPQAEHGVLAPLYQCVCQTDAGGGFALPCRGGVDGSNQNQLALSGGVFQAGDVQLGLVLAIVLQQLAVNASLGGHLVNGKHGGGLCDFDVSFHIQHSFA